ncbi:MAG: 3-dehydroquinate synthase [Chthoniobacter sp.]|jgi:3-dehydroquinate synthase|nr:3-dehydroquinate synthase [Chthoniobacter sp.]
MPALARVDVQLGSRSYPVLIGNELLDNLGANLRAAGLKEEAAFVLTNPPVGALYFDRARAALEAAGFRQVVRHDIPATEEGKNWDEFSKTCAALLENFPTTGSVPLVILLGGGVIGDLGGFAAGVFRRGVPFVQVPTTLLAAVDSSVGGKVAVNFGGVKNIMGIFNQPRLVVCDLALLQTLSARELRSGTSEVIKYGAVCDAALFAQLEGGQLERLLALEPAVVADIVAQCVALKARVVEQDEFDKKGIRNVLNFGHTIGHALELSADYALTHGEAIAIGMIAATRLAVRLGVCAHAFLERLQPLIERAGLPTVFPDSPGLFDRILRAMQMDKKFRDGKNLFVLPTGAGGWCQRENVDWALVHEAVRSVLA